MAKSKKQNTPEKKYGIYFLLVALVIILPLSFTNSTLDPTVAIRSLLLNISLVIMFAIFSFHLAKQKHKLAFIKSLIFPALVIYLVVSLLSLTKAINISVGYYDLSKTFLSLVLLIVASYIFQRNHDYKIILSKAMVINLVIASTIGIVQYFKFAFGKSDMELFDALYEIKGVMAHKNLYAISIFMLLPFSIFGLFQFRKWWFIASVYAIVLSLLLIVLLQTRSVWIATILFGLISTGLFVLTRKKTGFGILKLRTGKVYALVLVIIVLAGSGIIYKSPNTRELVTYKIQSIFDVSSHDNQGRLNIWGSTIEMTKENGLLGVGVGNWRIQYPKYFFKKQQGTFKNWLQPHNDFLWILSEKGIFGLISFILIFIFVLLHCIKIIKHAKKTDELIFIILMMSMIISFVSLSMFTFPYDRINHQVILMLVFSAVITEYSKHAKVATKKLSPIIVNSILVVLGTSLLFTLYANAQVFNSQKSVKKIYAEIDRNNYKKVIELSSRAYNPFFSLDYFSTSLLKHRATAYHLINKNNKAKKDFNKALEDHPYNISTLNNMAAFFAKQKDFSKSISYYQQALSFYPNYAYGIKNLSRAYYQNKEYQKAYLTILKYSTQGNDKQYQAFVEELKDKVNK